MYLTDGYWTLQVIADKEIKKEIYFTVEDESVLKLRGVDRHGLGEFTTIGLGTTKVYASPYRGSSIVAEIEVTVEVEPPPPHTQFYGSGTEDDPYQINEKYDLLLLKDKTTPRYGVEQEYYTNKYFELRSNITFEDYEWEGYIARFDGVFDGNGYSIKVGKVERDMSSGFFGKIDINGEIKNLSVDIDVETVLRNESWTANDDYAVLAISNYGKIQNCIITGSIVVQDYVFKQKRYVMVGGITPWNEGIISNCLVDVEITLNGNGSMMVGGLVGNLRGGKVENSVFIGSIKCEKQPDDLYGVGILIGWDQSSLGNIHLDNVYYDFIKVDNRTESEKELYDIPNEICGIRYTDTPLNAFGVSDWSTVDFFSWDQELWDFSGEVPKLKLFQ
ncbi:MAG: hypothetical protein LBT20_05925 [Clostridiales bacterium]|jgi:hypothetical protein|nr:hypothetical protein [Clostridiales bacterium]